MQKTQKKIAEKTNTDGQSSCRRLRRFQLNLMNGNQLYFSSVYPMDSIVTIRNLARGWIGTKYRLNIIQETQSCRYIRKRTTARGSEYSPKLLVINPQKIITNLNNYIKEFTM